MADPNTDSITFSDLNLPDPIQNAVSELGYEQPSPIQAESIPALLDGSDVLGQAQTGTGKTAAFALPMLSRVDAKNKNTQLLVLAPTRELAIQVAEACQQYAKYLKGVRILPIYGGQSYTIQLKQLKRGAQVIVGTPGRVMDHMRRKTLSLDDLNALVLDEADEMLRMGFIDDVKWVLEQSPPERQIALFSATMPKEIKKVAEQHLRNPAHIKVASKTVTAANISQRYWIVRGTRKLEALTRILESEESDGVIVFVRTKNATVELADKLTARGFRCDALNGDIPQANREKIVERLRSAKLDILVATDVVARGLDVERISHVINFDVPHDTESYVHRIGRTGRAGRSGQAILFVAPREKRMLFAIEKATKQSIEPMELPSVADINRNRIERFKDRLVQVVQDENLDFYSQLITELQHERELSSEQIAAAASFLIQGEGSLLVKEQQSDEDRFDRSDRRSPKRRGTGKPAPGLQATPLKQHPDIEMQRYRLNVGSFDQVKPSNIVGAIANESGLESQYIGGIEIMDNYTTVDLPADMPKEIMAILKKARVAGRALAIKVYRGEESRKDKHKPDTSAPGKKSYNSKKKKPGAKQRPTSEYAKKKRKERGKKKR